MELDDLKPGQIVVPMPKEGYWAPWAGHPVRVEVMCIPYIRGTCMGQAIVMDGRQFTFRKPTRAYVKSFQKLHDAKTPPDKVRNQIGSQCPGCGGRLRMRKHAGSTNWEPYCPECSK